MSRSRSLAMMRSTMIILVLFGARTAAAHDLKPGVVSLVEQSDGDFALHFVPPIDARGDAAEVTLSLPADCMRNGERVHCDRGLRGDVGVRGMTSTMKTLVVIERGGQRQEWMVTAHHPTVSISGAPPSRTLLWIRLGVEHILGGFDHLAFVIGLLLVLEVRLSRRLLFAISAFTVAHSLTLAIAALGILQVHTAPVEACIALSVLLVAREATHESPTAIRRWPWLAAALFGLVHGLGFAAALAEIGLPRAAVAWSLLWFNVGVELGQLAVVIAVVGLVALGRKLVGERRIIGMAIHRTACYALGSLAAYWLIERTAQLASGAG
jgi:hypothetical protein